MTREDAETAARLAEMILVVAEALEQLSATTGAFFPDGLPYFTEWPEAVRAHIGSEDALEYLYGALQPFAPGDARSEVQYWAEEIRQGRFPSAKA